MVTLLFIIPAEKNWEQREMTMTTQKRHGTIDRTTEVRNEVKRWPLPNCPNKDHIAYIGWAKSYKNKIYNISSQWIYKIMQIKLQFFRWFPIFQDFGLRSKRTNCIFHTFFIPLARSKYVFISSLSFIFTRWPARTATSIRWQFLFFMLIDTRLSLQYEIRGSICISKSQRIFWGLIYSDGFSFVYIALIRC